jgi:hypothetical protein
MYAENNMAHEELAKVLRRLEPVQQEKKEHADKLLEELKSSADGKIEADGFVFSLRSAPKRQSLDLKFLESAFKKFQRSHPDGDGKKFAKFVKEEQKKATNKNASTPRLSTKRKKEE